MRLVPEIQEKTPVPVPVRNHSDTPTSCLISTTYKIQNIPGHPLPLTKSILLSRSLSLFVSFMVRVPPSCLSSLSSSLYLSLSPSSMYAQISFSVLESEILTPFNSNHETSGERCLPSCSFAVQRPEVHYSIFFFDYSNKTNGSTNKQNVINSPSNSNRLVLPSSPLPSSFSLPSTKHGLCSFRRIVGRVDFFIFL